jgi:hypothetical protein
MLKGEYDKAGLVNEAFIKACRMEWIFMYRDIPTK